MSSDALSIVRGSSSTWRFTMEDSEGTPIDISSAEITFLVKQDKEDTSPTFQRQNSAAGGSASEIDFYTDGTDGIFDVFIIPSNTSGIEEGEYYYSAEVVIGSSVYNKKPELFEVIGDL